MLQILVSQPLGIRVALAAYISVPAYRNESCCIGMRNISVPANRDMRVAADISVAGDEGEVKVTGFT